MQINKGIFKSYDIRGIYPTDFDENVAYKVAQAYVKLYAPKNVAVGRDVRESGPKLFDAITRAFTDAGVDVVDLGVVSTDAFYFAVGELPVDGGITVSASHNPREYNGMNFCKKGAEPVSLETGLGQIRDMVIADFEPLNVEKKGVVSKADVTDDFLKRCISFIDPKGIKPMKVVANANFGVDVVYLNRAVSLFNLPLTVIPLNAKPDGTFPKGPPNPLLPENRKELLDSIVKEGANLGVAWDADGDRCFFADEKGNFLEGYFTTAIIATELLKKRPGSKIIIDPRLVWATQEAIVANGGTPVISKAGMTIIAARMKQEDAIFGGEMSSHFYFKENYYRDNGIIPLFLILEMMSLSGKKLSELAAPHMANVFITGELNFETENKDAIIEAAKTKYNDGKQEFIDGLSVEYDEWRFNLRKSNTEPLLRLNLEARSKETMEQKRDEIISLIKNFSNGH